MRVANVFVRDATTHCSIKTERDPADKPRDVGFLQISCQTLRQTEVEEPSELGITLFAAVCPGGAVVEDTGAGTKNADPLLLDAALRSNLTIVSSGHSRLATSATVSGFRSFIARTALKVSALYSALIALFFDGRKLSNLPCIHAEN